MTAATASTISRVIYCGLAWCAVALAFLTKEVIAARIYGGMHFRTSVVHGMVLGKKVAKWIAKHYFRPVE